MELSIHIAQIISIIYISAGIAVLIGTVDLNKLVVDLEKSSALTFVAGCAGIILGSIIVHYHNYWVKNWTILITIIAWFALIGGILIVVFPKCITYYRKFATVTRYWGVLMLILGMFFAYFGFFA